MVVKTQIRLFQKNDYSACAKIYKDGMDTGIATFETKVPDWDTWNAKFLKQCRFVAEANQTILGWCALTPFSLREVYKGVAEVTIYVAKEAQQKGIGKLLLQHLIKESEKANFWTYKQRFFQKTLLVSSYMKAMVLEKLEYDKKSPCAVGFGMIMCC